LFGPTFGCCAGAHHERDIGPVDVGVDEADLVAHAGESDGQVDRDRGFAYAALAGADCDDFPTPGSGSGAGGMECPCAMSVVSFQKPLVLQF
jgi:hypothetical protein